METRRLTIDNRPVVVLDDAIVDMRFDEFVQFITGTAAFVQTQTDSQESFLMTGAYWVYKIKKDIFLKTPIYQQLLELTNAHLDTMPWELVEAYVNSNQYGDNSYIHKDGNSYQYEHSVTCLVYLNETWSPDFAGETLFYNSKDDAIIAISPKFKRTVIFDGQISHRASPPSRICPARRLVLVVKFGANGVTK